METGGEYTFMDCDSRKYGPKKVSRVELEQSPIYSDLQEII